MKYFIILFSLLFRLIPLSAQNAEFTGALNRNTYFDYYNDEGQSTSEYISKTGYAFLLSAEDTIIKSFFLRITLSLENYNGNIDTYEGGLGGGSGTEADVNKTVLGVNIYPLNVKIGKLVWLNIGPSFNYLIHKSMKGQHVSWRGTSTGIKSETVDLNSNANANNYNNRFNVGLNIRIAPEIKIYDRWALLPQYLAYFGLTTEFRNVEANIVSFRQYLGIGIMKRFNPNHRKGKST